MTWLHASFLPESRGPGPPNCTLSSVTLFQGRQWFISHMTCMASGSEPGLAWGCEILQASCACEDFSMGTTHKPNYCTPKKKWSLGVGGWLPDVKRVILAVFRVFFPLSLSFPPFLGSIVVGREGHLLWQRVEQVLDGLYVKSLASASSLHWTPLQVQVKGTICSKAVQLAPPHNRTLVPWLALAHQSALWSSQPVHEGGWQDKT